MCRWIYGGFTFVVAPGHDLPTCYDYRSDRYLPELAGSSGLDKG